MDSSRTALRLLMAELARARRAMAHGNVDEARRALDAALAIDSNNVQALDWRAELDGGAPVVHQSAPIARPPVAAGGWIAFEQRVRERRARRRTEAARTALLAGDHATAREVLDELSQLAPEHPDVVALQRELARFPAPATLVAAESVARAPDDVSSAPIELAQTFRPSPGDAEVQAAPLQASSLGLRWQSVTPTGRTPAAVAVPRPAPVRPTIADANRAGTVKRPSGRWFALAAAAIVLAGLGGVLSYTVFSRVRDLSSNNHVDTADQRPGAVASSEVVAPPFEAEAPLSSAEPVSTADEPVSTGGEHDTHVTANEIVPGEQRREPVAAAPAAPASPASPGARAATAPSASNAVQPGVTRATNDDTTTRTPLPSREYPGATLETSIRTQPERSPAAANAPALPDLLPETTSATLPETIGSRPAPDDPVGVASRQPAATSNPAGAAAVPPPPSNTSVPSRPTDTNSAAKTVDPAAAAEASVRQVLDRYVRAYNKLDASAAHAVWPSVDKAALERAFGELSAQTLRFDRCTVAVDEEAGTATCSGNAQWVPRVGGQGPKRERRTWRFELGRNGDDWIITRAEARR